MSGNYSSMTRQKKAILDVIKKTDIHPTADWIYREARKVVPDISLGTVYRNLRTLKEEGRIMELEYGRSINRYDGNSENHYHFVCKKCGKVYDVDCNTFDNVERELEERNGVKVLGHRLEFFGFCSECK